MKTPPQTFLLDGDGTAYITKVPDDALDYAFNWSALLDTGETIAASTWTADTGLTLSTRSIEGPITVQWLQGGAVGMSYFVTNEITTSLGRTYERSFRIDVIQRLS